VTVLSTRRIRPRLYKPGGLGSWTGHLPFVHELVTAFRPSLFVELGTHYGESYFGTCQAVEENGVDCRCVAVDTWRGDIHAGFYDESVFQEVAEYNRTHYREFSSLLRSTFDGALGKFSDGSVDLLHIDGLHTYEAVKHDFESWLPKVRAGGIVMLHDTQARHAEFAVWKFWDELAQAFDHFEFTHSWGLGVLRKDGEDTSEAEFVKQLWHSPPETRNFIRHYYALQAEVLEASHQQPAKEVLPATEILVQAFPCLEAGYSEANAASQHVPPGVWHELLFRLPGGSPSGPIRIDPADRPCTVTIAGIRLRREIDRAVIKSWTEPDALRSWHWTRDVVHLPSEGTARFLTLDRDPQFFLPEFEGPVGDQPLLLELSMKLDVGIGEAVGSVRKEAGADSELFERERAEWVAARHAFEVQVHALESFLASAAAELSDVGIVMGSHYTVETGIQDLRSSLRDVSRELISVRMQLNALLIAAQEFFERAELPPRLAGDTESRQDAIVKGFEAAGAALDRYRRSLRATVAERDRLLLEIRQAQREENRARADVRALRNEQITSVSELREGRARIAALTADLDDIRSRLRNEREQSARLEMDLGEVRSQISRMNTALQVEHRGRLDLLESYSWKATAPFRTILGMLLPIQKNR
jgi:hypothetical protein